MFKPEILENFALFIDFDGLAITLEKMFQFKWSIASLNDVEGEIQSAFNYSHVLIAIQKEVGLKKNEIMEIQITTQSKENISWFWTTVQATGTLAKIKTATDRNKYMKIKEKELAIAPDKVSQDFDVILKFINEQLWETKKYIDYLMDKRHYYCTLEASQRKII